VATFIVITYDIVSEKAAKAAYNMYAVLGLDALMVIFWLSTMGSLAALRATFNIPVGVTIVVDKRDLVKRAVATNMYLSIMVGAIIVAAIEMYVYAAIRTILFILPFNLLTFKGSSSSPHSLCSELAFTATAVRTTRPTQIQRDWN
jgi:hypothetical protein